MALSMRSAAAGTGYRVYSSGKKAAAPRPATPAQHAQRGQQFGRDSAPAPAVAARRRTLVQAVATKEAASQKQAAGTKVTVAEL
jgi:hypothetical protein